VEKWSLPAQSSSPSRGTDADSKDISSEDTDSGTPKISSSQNTDNNFENIPPKKRPFLQKLQQQLQEEASSSEGETSDSTKPKESSVINNLASNLLDSWKDLKEVFKIPKIKVEERKKNEEELGITVILSFVLGS
jgi:hypothetical protein